MSEDSELSSHANDPFRVDQRFDQPPGPALAAVLASVDLSTTNGYDLVQMVTAHHRQVAFAQAQFLRAVREMARAVPGITDGSAQRRSRAAPDAGSELGFAIAVSDYTADLTVATAMFATDTAPELLQALECGRLDLPKLAMLQRELRLVDDPDNVRAVVAALTADFATSTVGQLRGKLRTLLLRIEPAAVRQRHAKALEERKVDHQEFANGTSSIAATYLRKDRAAAAWANIDSIARAKVARGDSERRNIDQIRADVFVDLLSGADPGRAGATAPAAAAGSINIHIGLATLACLNDHPAALPGFGPVLAEIARQTIRQMAETAQWRFTVEDESGQAIAQGPLRRRPTPRQRAFIAARDQTCRAPGCRRPAIRCDIDHVTPWSLGGTTTIDNLLLLCRRHHRLKHRHRYQVRRTCFGTEWVTPLGHRYTKLHQDAPEPGGLAMLVDRFAHGVPGPSHLRR